MIHHDTSLQLKFGKLLRCLRNKDLPIAYLSTHPLWSTLSHPHGAEHGSVSLGHGKVIYLQSLDDLLTTTGQPGRQASVVSCLSVSHISAEKINQSLGNTSAHNFAIHHFTRRKWSQVRGIKWNKHHVKDYRGTVSYCQSRPTYSSLHMPLKSMKSLASIHNHGSTKTANAQPVESFSRGA